MRDKAPVFVKINDYKDIVDILALIKDRIGQAKTLLDKINELKKQEEEELDAWSREIEEVASRVDEVDTILLKPEL